MRRLLDVASERFVLYVAVGAVSFIIASLAARFVPPRWRHAVRLALVLVLILLGCFLFPPAIAVPRSGRGPVFYAEEAGLTHGLLTLLAWPTACLVGWIIDVVKTKKHRIAEQESGHVRK